MRQGPFRAAALAATAVSASLFTAPAAAAPVSLRSFAHQQVRLATLAYHMGVESQNVCTDPGMTSGLLLHDLSQYEPAIRPAIARAFSLRAGVGVIQVVPGSPADRAGLKVDDEIVGMNGYDVTNLAAVTQRKKSFARMERLNAFLQKALKRAPVQLSVRRAGSVLQLILRGERSCGGQLSLIDSNEENAWSDGTNFAVTTAMTRLARSDDEIAFVIAHEMAHNILGHSRSSMVGIFGLGLGISRARKNEIDADQFAVRLMQAAGYRPAAAIFFLQAARRRFWWSISLDHPGFGSRIRAVSAAMSQPYVASSAPTSRRDIGPTRMSENRAGRPVSPRGATQSISQMSNGGANAQFARNSKLLLPPPGPRSLHELHALGRANAIIVVAAAKSCAAAGDGKCRQQERQSKEAPFWRDLRGRRLGNHVLRSRG